MNFHEVVKAAHRKSVADRKAEAELAEPKLRGGSAGAVINGKSFGACQRISLLRGQGVDLPIVPAVATFNQFAGGYANEDIVYKQLVDGGVPEDRIRREDEMPVRWTSSNGTAVTGRPDIVVLDDSGRPETLFELKSVVSLWTAKSVHYELKPKSDNLIQAAHYAMHLDTPEILLVYSNRSQFHLSTAPRWLQNKFPPGTYDVEFKDNGDPMKIMAFDRVYRLKWNDEGCLTYWTEGLDVPVVTHLTKDSVTAYYESVAQHLHGEEMPPRPGKLAVDGSKTYLPCQYCALSDTCDEFETNRAEWEDQVKVKVGELEAQQTKELAPSE